MSKWHRKARFIGCNETQIKWGSNDDPNGLLEVGGEYEIERVDVHTWHTKIYLVDFPDKGFNSVCFEPVGGSNE